MIVQCQIYVLGKGFIPVDEVSPGDQVYRLNGMKPEVGQVDSVSSEIVNDRLYHIQTGLQQVIATEDTRYPYYSEENGLRYIAFNQIERLTPNKEYSSTKFLPVLSMPMFEGTRTCSDQELEYLVRMMVLEKISLNLKEFFSISTRMNGDDAFVFIDILEHWASVTPGAGFFGRNNRKSRAFFFLNKEVSEEICRLACLVGCCTMMYESESGYALQIFFEGMPIPGNVPKNEKYKRAHYYGPVYNLNSNNLPVFGRYGTRAYYLPFTSTLNAEVYN